MSLETAGRIAKGSMQALSPHLRGVLLVTLAHRASYPEGDPGGGAGVQMPSSVKSPGFPRHSAALRVSSTFAGVTEVPCGSTSRLIRPGARARAVRTAAGH